MNKSLVPTTYYLPDPLEPTHREEIHLVSNLVTLLDDWLADYFWRVLC
jgi:hypothetical protein